MKKVIYIPVDSNHFARFVGYLQFEFCAGTRFPALHGGEKSRCEVRNARESFILRTSFAQK
jgi:hypothetical protein